jgi:hypothetical protein
MGIGGAPDYFTAQPATVGVVGHNETDSSQQRD